MTIVMLFLVGISIVCYMVSGILFSEVKKIDRCENNSADPDSSQMSSGDRTTEPVCDSHPRERVTPVEQGIVHFQG